MSSDAFAMMRGLFEKGDDPWKGKGMTQFGRCKVPAAIEAIEDVCSWSDIRTTSVVLSIFYSVQNMHMRLAVRSSCSIL